jgi:putative FmdB family regulatory protein
MPIYQYCCQACGHSFEVLQRLGEGAEQLRCPQCGAPEPVKQVAACAVGKSQSLGGCAGGSGFS